MSKGNTIITVRFGPEQLAEMEATITRRNENSPREPWTVGEFIRQAVAEKVAHMKRSRSRRPKPA